MKEIMLVDDSAPIRAAMTLILKNSGFVTHEAVSGEDALIQLKKDLKPNLFICDLNMPGMDGITLVKHIREMPQFKFVPILMLTTESIQTKRAEAKAAGATGWLVKPVPAPDLLAVLKQVLPGA